MHYRALRRQPRTIDCETMTDPIEKFEVNEIEHEAEDARDWSRYGADDASVEAYKEIVSWSPERFAVEDRKFARRLDFMIGLPILVLYIMNYLDRNSIAQGEYCDWVGPSG